jgi:hypothetical protein
MDNVPPLIMLLNDNNDGRLAALSTLTKLANHGEFVVVCYLDITNADMKSSFAGKPGRRFYHLSLC